MTDLDFDIRVKVAIYAHFAETGARPSLEEVAQRIRAGADAVRAAYPRLRTARVLLLEPDGTSIRMAPPFSGIPTQHVVESAGTRYYANCAWDALGIAAALHREAVVHSECAQTKERLTLPVGKDGPGLSEWLFHCLVPAAHWWDDLVFT